MRFPFRRRSHPLDRVAVMQSLLLAALVERTGGSMFVTYEEIGSVLQSPDAFLIRPEDGGVRIASRPA